MKARQYPVQGDDVVLTIDRELQAKAEQALEGREGVVVALDPQTGEILALASSPTYDPNKFITRFTPEEWPDLITDPASPLENRAIRGLYAPGSIFKLVMGVGGLDLRLRRPGDDRLLLAARRRSTARCATAGSSRATAP